MTMMMNDDEDCHLNRVVTVSIDSSLHRHGLAGTHNADV